MAELVTMAKFGGWTMKEGRIVKWYKKEGDPVQKGEILCDVETEKVTTGLESLFSGVLWKIIADEGTVVQVAGPVAVIAGPEEKSVDVSSLLTKSTTMPTAGTTQVLTPVEKHDEVQRIRMEDRIVASPSARKLAQEHRIDISKMRGSGPGGRIVREDILALVEARKESPPQIMIPGGTVLTLVGKRKIIADRMFLSATTTARVTITMEVDMSRALEIYERLQRTRDPTSSRLTITDMIVKATAISLKSHPIVNSVWLEDGIHVLDDINIGVAVALEDGLIVPVIPKADQKSLEQIAALLRDLTEKARHGRLSSNEVTGGTFTITNLGMFGVDIHTPIIDPPQSAILGVGKIADRPVVVNGEIRSRPTMHLSLSFDHRVFDGAPAARFLQTLKDKLERADALIQ